MLALKVGVMWSQAKECRHPPDAVTGQDQIHSYNLSDQSCGPALKGYLTLQGSIAGRVSSDLSGGGCLSVEELEAGSGLQTGAAQVAVPWLAVSMQGRMS